MPKCKINGQEIEVPEGTSIIEAYKKLDHDIAHYCWHPGLSVAGVCRLCMVEIEGNPKLQIACNTTVQEGMVINNNSEMVKDTVKWGLDFHLINHPLDCPICDQAGECGLQDQYMQFGKYDPEMAEPKVKKRKVVDLGPSVVLDTERCILCSRCVRFTEEVSQTHELGIFNRGDRSEIGTFKDKPLDNNYSLNTVDICPVGALTSKDFRFRQRVWYLKNADTICTGCATGCSVTVYYNEEGMWRVKPRYNPEINGYWMCDKGRDIYKYVNEKVRLREAFVKHNNEISGMDPMTATKAAGKELLRLAEQDANKVALVVTGQYTDEELEDIIEMFAKDIGTKQVYHWINNPEIFDDFDGLLLRGDRNPNTAGLLKQLKSHNLTAEWKNLVTKLESGAIEGLVIVGPENQAMFPDLDEKVALFSKAKSIVWLTAGPIQGLESVEANSWQIPLKTFVEKSGTYTNFQGRGQKVSLVTTIVESALTVSEATQLLSGTELSVTGRPQRERTLKTNHFTALRGIL